jgi:acyl carrier protein
LPAPPARETVAASDDPLTPMEAAIAAVWRHVLQVPHVGRTDNFFDLGGHSLTAIRIVAALEDRLGRHVPIRQLFLTPTVSELAQSMEAAPVEGAAPLVRVPDRPWYPISSAQRVQWMVHQMSAGHEWHPPRVLQLDGALDRGAFDAALQGLVDRHDALRTSFAERDGDVVQIVQDRFEMLCAFEDLSGLPPDDRAARVRALLQAESKRPIDLTRLPLLDVRLVRLEPLRHLLLLLLPHIVTDGWTEGILVADFAELYSAHRAGRAASLPPLELRYVDVSSREQEWLGTPPLQSQKAYWLERFSGHVPDLRLPADPVSGERGDRRAAFATALVDDETIAALRQTAKTHGATMFVALLSAFEVLLSRLSGQSDLVVGTTVAARGRPELERVAGVFANTLPLRTTLAGNPRFAEILRRVGETTLAGLANQDYPFHGWIDELRRRRGQPDLRLFSAFFVVHEEAFGPEFEGLAARWFGTDAFGNALDARALKWDQRQQVAFAANDTGRGWRVTILGDSSELSEVSLEHMLEQWIAIVRQVAANPELRLADVDLPAGPGGAPAYATVALDRDEIDHLFA